MRVSLGTTAAFNRCVDAIRNHKAHAAGAFDEYCGAFTENLERFRLSKSDGEFDDSVVKSIEEFLPSRNEAIQLFTAIAQYAVDAQFIQSLHRFFERMIPYLHRPQNVSQYSDWDWDNYKFIVHELFLHALAALLKHERIEQANCLLQQQYYLPGNSDYGRDVMTSYSVFGEHMTSLEHRNTRLGLRRMSLRADLLKERCTGTGIDFRHLLQADFVAFMRAEIAVEDEYKPWWPETLVWLGDRKSVV